MSNHEAPAPTHRTGGTSSPAPAPPGEHERSGFLSDEDVAARVLQHIRDRTTDLGGEVWREPVENYRSRERCAREIDTVLRRWPVPFCPGAALPDVGSYVAREAAGIPLVAVRGEDGRVRAFRNACRHPGTSLAAGAGRR